MEKQDLGAHSVHLVGAVMGEVLCGEFYYLLSVQFSIMHFFFILPIFLSFQFFSGFLTIIIA